MGENQIFNDRLGFSSLANAKKLSSKRFDSITGTEPEKLKKHIKEVLLHICTLLYTLKDYLFCIRRYGVRYSTGFGPRKDLYLKRT